MYSASSPGPSPMWYCRSPAGIAIRRSRRVSTRWSAFGKTTPSLRWLLRRRETRPRIVPPSHERQAEWIVLRSRSAERATGGSPVGGAAGGPECAPGGPRPGAPAGADRGAGDQGSSQRSQRQRDQGAESGQPGADAGRSVQEAGVPVPRAASIPGEPHRRRLGCGLRHGPRRHATRARRGHRPGRCRPDRRRRRPARRADRSTRPIALIASSGSSKTSSSRAASAQDDAARSRSRRRATARRRAGRRPARRPGRVRPIVRCEVDHVRVDGRLRAVRRRLARTDRGGRTGSGRCPAPDAATGRGDPRMRRSPGTRGRTA